jgi:hypothetical protein
MNILFKFFNLNQDEIDLISELFANDLDDEYSFNLNTDIETKRHDYFKKKYDQLEFVKRKEFFDKSHKFKEKYELSCYELYIKLNSNEIQNEDHEELLKSQKEYSEEISENNILIFNEEYEYILKSNKKDEKIINQDELPESIKSKYIRLENVDNLYKKMLKERKTTIYPIEKRFDISYSQKLKDYIYYEENIVRPNDNNFHKYLKI